MRSRRRRLEEEEEEEEKKKTRRGRGKEKAETLPPLSFDLMLLSRITNIIPVSYPSFLSLLLSPDHECDSQYDYVKVTKTLTPDRKKNPRE